MTKTKCLVTLVLIMDAPPDETFCIKDIWRGTARTHHARVVEGVNPFKTAHMRGLHFHCLEGEIDFWRPHLRFWRGKGS